MPYYYLLGLIPDEFVSAKAVVGRNKLGRHHRGERNICLCPLQCNRQKEHNIPKWALTHQQLPESHRSTDHAIDCRNKNLTSLPATTTYPLQQNIYDSDTGPPASQPRYQSPCLLCESLCPDSARVPGHSPQPPPYTDTASRCTFTTSFSSMHRHNEFCPRQPLVPRKRRHSLCLCATPRVMWRSER